MKHFYTAIFVFTVAITLPSVIQARTSNDIATPTPAKLQAIQQAAQLLFTENKGQVTDDKGLHRPDILFTAHSGGAQLFLSATSINYQFTKTTYPAGYDRKHHLDPEKQAAIENDIRREICRFSLTLVGANTHPAIRKELKNTYTENFYTAGCLDGITGIGTYQRIVYQNVYPHIDWVVYSNGNRLKYDFLVHPGGDPKQIKLKIDDAQSVTITNAGELVMKTALGEIKEDAPISYADGAQVKTTFKKNRDGSIGFDVAAYEGELRIDPNVVWATYYGGSGDDVFYGCVLDATGNLFATGVSGSSGIASSGAYQVSNNGNNDIILVKFSATGNRLWATYYGGSGSENCTGCATDGSGDVYICGYTTSSGLATAGSFQDSLLSFPGLPTYNALLAKFNTNGTRIWATYFGVGEVQGSSCAVDALGNVYMAGVTDTADHMTTSGAFQTTFGGGTTDGFIVKFDASGARQWCTYYGGSGFDAILDIVVDVNANIYVAGTTQSLAGIATSTGGQSVFGGMEDAFLAKFSSAGGRQWGTYYGGSGIEDVGGGWAGHCLCLDASGNVYLTGRTNTSTGLASLGAYQSALSGIQDAFLVKFKSVGIRDWSTYFGGPGSELGTCVFADSSGGIYMTGSTSSSTAIATPCTYQTSYGGGNSDAFFAYFDSLGNESWATYYGGTGTDILYCTATNGSGNVYLAGSTTSTSGIATANSFQNTFGGGGHSGDGFIAKFICPPHTISTGTITGSPFCTNISLTIPYTAADTFNSCNVFTAQLSDPNGSFAAPTVIATHPGTVSGTFVTSIPSGVNPGTGYRIRVVSSSPYVIGTDNGIDLVIYTAPKPVFTTLQPTVRCQGADTILYTASAGTGIQINYSMDAISTAFPGNSINSITGKVIFAAGWRGTSVITAGAQYCGNFTYAYDTVLTLPTPTPVISYIGSQLCASGYAHYQWYLNGVAIAGDTTSCISHTTGGDYTVKVTSSAGCIGTSSIFHLNTGINNITADQIKLYPNPTTNIINIKAPGRVNVAINSIDGRQILYAMNARTIDISRLPDAVYVVKVYDDNNTLVKVEKLVKTGE